MASMKTRSYYICALAFAALAASASAQSCYYFQNRGVVNTEPMVRRDASYEEAMLRPAIRPYAPRVAEPEVVQSSDGPTVSGSRAVMRRGIAYAPSQAPQAVKELIWSVNRLQRMPYKWGGGHGSFSDDGYDCSGTISYALHHAGVLGSPLTSSDLSRWGQGGRGRWVTVYARNGHVFAVVAGLRLDAMGSEMGRQGGPRWHSDMRSTRGFAARTLAGL